MLKKALSVILSAVILTSCTFSVIGQASDSASVPFSFAVASDLHYNLPDEEITPTDPELLDDPVFWYANRRCSLENESGFIIDEFLRQCAENDEIKFVLISGDLADDGKTDIAELKAVAAKLDKFEETTGKQVYVINGNHDTTDNGETGIEEFKQVCFNLGYDEALDTLEGTCSYTADLGSEYRLIALDTNDGSKSTEDGMNAERLAWVKKSAEQAYADGRYPILMMHHNLLDHMPLQRIFSRNFIVKFHYTTAELFADWGIKFVISGHEHCSDAASFTSAAGNTITDFAGTSLTMYPLAYRVFTFSDEEIDYKLCTIDSIDTDALTQTVGGYTDEQISLMNSGMNEYSKQFLKAGLVYRLRLSLSMEKIGIDESSAFYDLVNTAVTGLTNALDMPLYGEGGLQEKAKDFNIDIPDSNYENGWDLASEIVSWHYSGSESFALDSVEIRLLLKIVDYVLLADLSDVNDKVFLKSINSVTSDLGITDSVCTDFTETAAELFGPVTPGEYLLLGIASPIIYSFTNDDDLDDNNGSIEGYNPSVPANNANNILNNIISIINKIALYLGNFFKIIFRTI